MKIINLNVRKSAAIMAVAALFSLGYGLYTTHAAPGDVAISPSAGGTAVLGANGSTTVLETFSPDLDLKTSLAATLATSTVSSTTTGYYGIDVVGATTTNDVRWKISVSHATADLVPGDVAIKEVGTYNETRGRVRDATYTYSSLSGDLMLEGDVSWDLHAGDRFTNIDQIVFGASAPLGTYTITRTLSSNEGETLGTPFSFTVALTAGSGSTTPDTTAPAAPVVLFPTSPHSTSTNPIVIGGTAEINSLISITGGATSTNATTSNIGIWNATINLTASSTNNLQVTATDAAGNVSSSTNLIVTHASSTSGTTTPDTTAPAAPVIVSPLSPHSTSTSPIMVRGTAEANSHISITGGASSTSATTSAGGLWNALVNLHASSTNTLLVTATDAAGNTSSSTTLIVTHTATSTSGTTTPPTSTSTPTITLSGDQSMTIFSCNGFTDPGATAVDSSGASITATSTGAGGIRNPGTYTITYTATDAAGNTATTTRTVVVKNCSAGGGGRGGGGAPFTVIPPSQSGNLPPGPPINTPPVQFIANPGGFIPPGQVLPGQVLGASAGVNFQFLSNLTVGSRGQDVIELQTRLTAIGFYKGPITGYFGGLTKAAVTAFQKANGLPATGYFGPMTRALFNS